jgi:ATP-binding cassette, subfamily B, bacterial
MLRLGRWSAGYAARQWPGLLAVSSTMLLNIGLNVLRPWPMKVLVDEVLNARRPSGNLAAAIHLLPGSASRDILLIWVLAATVTLFVLGWAIGVVSAYANIAFGQRMIYRLAGDLFGHMQRLSLRFHSRQPVGDSIRRITTDSVCVSTIVGSALLPTLASLVTLGTMFAIMWKLDSTLLLLSLIVVPFMAIVSRYYARPMFERSYQAQQIESQQYVIVEQTLSAIPIVQAFGREEHNNRRFQETTHGILAASLASTSIDLQFKIWLGAATSIGTAGILWIGAQHVMEGRLTIGSLLVFLAYLDSLYGPVHALVYTSSTIQGAAGSAQRVLQILDTKPEVQDRAGAIALPPVQGHVRIEHAVFGYEQEQPVLRDICIEALPGETVAIVGATGVGKSTLVSLIPRFFDPWSGRVTIDGYDVRDVQVKSVREQVALVLQEPFLFPVSIADNIAYGRPDAGRDEIEAAARAANAHAFIDRLPAGYDTMVGERGATLSGGERQRLSIARALLKDAPILILDEPTSALDAETESLLLEALERLMQGRTTFIIAHRLSTIRRADRIVVLQDGTVVETETHTNLLASNGVYARLHRIQLGERASATTSGVG